jgi:hypothetical protein
MKHQHIVAVGMSSGVVLLQVPAAAPAGSAGSAQQSQPLPILAALGEPKPSVAGGRVGETAPSSLIPSKCSLLPSHAYPPVHPHMLSLFLSL